MDDLRFAALNERCKVAREEIFQAFRTTSIDIEDEPWSKVVNEQYAPHFIATQLMVDPKVVETINLRYEDNVSSSAECRGRFVNVVKGLDSMPKAVKCVERRHSEGVPAADVLVKVEHGQLERDIRPLSLKVVHVPTGRLLAVQTTYELLLGHMHSPKNRMWYGMGFAEVSRSCKLTSPRVFLSRVLGQA